MASLTSILCLASWIPRQRASLLILAVVLYFMVYCSAKSCINTTMESRLAKLFNIHMQFIFSSSVSFVCVPVCHPSSIHLAILTSPFFMPPHVDRELWQRSLDPLAKTCPDSSVKEHHVTGSMSKNVWPQPYNSFTYFLTWEKIIHEH